MLWIILGSLAIGLSPRLDFLEVLIFLYWPTIRAFELNGHYVGEANIIKPLMYGVLLGIPINGIIVAAAVCLVKRRR